MCHGFGLQALCSCVAGCCDLGFSDESLHSNNSVKSPSPPLDIKYVLQFYKVASGEDFISGGGGNYVGAHYGPPNSSTAYALRRPVGIAHQTRVEFFFLCLLLLHVLPCVRCP